MAEPAAAHTSRYKGTVFKSRLEARYAAFFDLAGWAWKYEPMTIHGWTPSFEVTIPCSHSECSDHTLLVEVKPYPHLSDFEGHPGTKYPYGDDFNGHTIPADASACFGASPKVSSFEMSHGNGGGTDDIPCWVGNWETMWETADSEVESEPRIFAAKVLKALKTSARDSTSKGKPFQGKHAEEAYLDTCRAISSAVHFEVTFDAIKPDINVPIPSVIHLPYKNITIHVGNDNCLIVASDYDIAAYWDNGKEYVDDAYSDGFVCVRAVWLEKGNAFLTPYMAITPRDLQIEINKKNGHRIVYWKFEKLVGHALPKDVEKPFEQFVSEAAAMLVAFLSKLATTHTEEVIQQASPKNNRRILDGKLPIWEVKTLVLKTPVTRTVSEYQGGTHASPRQHIRRGHYRHYKSGKTAWVRDCIVGSLEKGFVHKDYRVEPAAA